MKLLIERKYRKIYFDKFNNPFYKKKNSKIYINKKLLKYGGNTDELKKLEELFQNQNILEPELYNRLKEELNKKQGTTDELRTIFNEIKAIVEKMDDDQDTEKLQIILEIVDLIISICKSTTETEVPEPEPEPEPVPAPVPVDSASVDPVPAPTPAEPAPTPASAEPAPAPTPTPAEPAPAPASASAEPEPEPAPASAEPAPTPTEPVSTPAVPKAVIEEAAKKTEQVKKQYQKKQNK